MNDDVSNHGGCQGGRWKDRSGTGKQMEDEVGIRRGGESPGIGVEWRGNADYSGM